MSEQRVLSIHGVARRGGVPLEGAYINLMDPTKDFLIAERRTGSDGTFSFHTTPGRWVLELRSAGSDVVRQDIDGEAGRTDVAFDL